ncbi:MAG TPA: glycosyltransferase [Anaeromyxobacteraceae bacterium]|nr:glycosyltransferase [Anaeromyxobacteraceae bacterium]
MPRVSIVIPTFNRLGMLAEAVTSALAQRYPDLEVLVSDNASEDGTREAMQAHIADRRFRYFRNETNLGMVANWRKAVFEHARGDFFLILSDDDRLIDPDYVSKAMALVQRHPQVVMVYADGYILDESTGTRRELRLPFGSLERGTTVFASRDRVFPQDFTLCNVLFKRSLAMELDAFDNPLNLCCDSELFLKTCLFGDVGVIHDLVSEYRLHGANLIHRHHQDLRIYAANLDFFFKPRRLAIERRALTRRQLRDFDQSARRAVRVTVRLVAERHPGQAGELVDRLWETGGWLTLRALFHRRTAGLALGGLTRRLRRVLPWETGPPRVD